MYTAALGESACDHLLACATASIKAPEGSWWPWNFENLVLLISKVGARVVTTTTTLRYVYDPTHCCLPPPVSAAASRVSAPSSSIIIHRRRQRATHPPPRTMHTCALAPPLPATGVAWPCPPAALALAHECLLSNKSDVACRDMVLKCRPSVRLNHPQLRLPPRHPRQQLSRLQSLSMTMIAI